MLTFQLKNIADLLVAIGLLFYYGNEHQLGDASLLTSSRRRTLLWSARDLQDQVGDNSTSSLVADSLRHGYCGNSTLPRWTCISQYYPVYCKKTPMKSCKHDTGNATRYDPRELRLGEFPSFALLTFASSTNFSMERKCGGAIIDSDRVITAAQCISKDYDSLAVQTGMVNLNNPEHQQVRYGFVVCIIEGFKAPDVNKTNSHAFNDIAIIQVDKPFQFDNFTQPACLEFEREVSPNATCHYVAMGVANNSMKAYAGLVAPNCQSTSPDEPSDEYQGGRCWKSKNNLNFPCETGNYGWPLFCVDSCKGGIAKQYLVGTFNFNPSCPKNEKHSIFADTYKLAAQLGPLLDQCREIPSKQDDS